MVTEFNIYLRDRVHECDIIIYSLPYRDGLTATNRMIIDNCIKSYSLYKIVAQQFDTELSAHIDNMLKTCYEKLHLSSDIDVNVDFQTHYAVYPEANILEFDNTELDALIHLFAKAESAMVFGVSPLLSGIAKSLGRGESIVSMDAEVLGDVIERSFFELQNKLSFLSSVEDTDIQKFFKVEAPIVLSADLTNLCYRITSTANTTVEIAALVLGTEIHFSFGRAYNGIAFDIDLQKNQVEKFEVVNNVMSLVANTCGLLYYHISGVTSGMVFSAGADSIVKRHRLLSEMDNTSLSSFDSMTIDELDYVILT